MSKSDLIQKRALVLEVGSAGIYKVRDQEGVERLCKLSGKLKRFRKRVNTGDWVQIGMSPYDLSNAMIIDREDKPKD